MHFNVVNNNSGLDENSNKYIPGKDYIAQSCASDAVFEDDIWDSILTQPVINDPMMSETCAQPLSKNTAADHCYSASQEQKARSSTKSNSYSAQQVKSQTYHSVTQTQVGLKAVKMEPKVITVKSSNSIVYDGRLGRPAQSLLKQSGNPLVKTVNTTPSHRLIYPVTRVKTEPRLSAVEDEDNYANHMPITPPSSNQSSDSEGGTSPRTTPPNSPIRQVLVARATGYRYNPATAIYSQPIPTSGVLRLTEEEKRTFITEGYPVPSKLPLTKAEERNLKKVRRKIKNKISAQESRRKKKEYMDQLERKVEDIVKENNDLKQKCDKFENNNRTLMAKVGKLQAILKSLSPKQVTTQAGTCLFVMVLCLAVFIGNWSPFSSTLSPESPVDSHSLHSLDTSFTSFHVSGGRTLTALVDEEVLYKEPWLITVAKHSIQWTVHLITRASPSMFSSVQYNRE
ncbi:CREB3L1 [Bugula neritina]|uniref:CREB3L1 n=1 Tax=Bugula neritina TaxID=10212 RepID=A0A7J7KER0_BUGNE|nr:CREB3L1 [Bugula neritina]